jgi:hypothetical protein
MTEMQNALSAGKEVTVHQSPITQSGWTGTGYIITDPVTGAGAYKISGGANGGVMILAILATIVILSLASIQFLAIYGGLTMIGSLAGFAGLLAPGLLIYNTGLDPLLIFTPRMAGIVTLSIGVGSLMGSIGLGLAAALIGPMLLAIVGVVAIELFTASIDGGQSFTILTSLTVRKLRIYRGNLSLHYAYT